MTTPSPARMQLVKAHRQAGKEMKVQIAGAELERLQTSGTYFVMLINITDRCMALGRITQPGQQPGPWFAINPPICRTCSTDCDDCHEKQRWVAVMSTNCDAGPFDLTLITTPDPNGNAWGATWSIVPNCQYAGGAICLA